MKKKNSIWIMNAVALVSIGLALSLAFQGCMSAWKVSDEEAVILLKDYYSFYEEKGVDAEIVNRGRFSQDCECYPIEFYISEADRESFRKTFYFYKNGDGTAGIKKFKFGTKYDS